MSIFEQVALKINQRFTSALKLQVNALTLRRRRQYIALGCEADLTRNGATQR
jgi:hypothetical protein